MDKVARLFVSRLRHLARREARRIALRNGLLEGKIVEVDGHLLCRYNPAFDTAALTGDPVRDRAWFRRHFGAGLVARKETSNLTSVIGGDVVVTMETVDEKRASPLVAFPRKHRATAAQDAALGNGVDRRTYAVGLVGRAADPPLVSHVVAALVLARAVAKGARPLRDVIRAIAQATPVVTLHAPLAGFEREVLRLMDKSRFLPSGPFAIIDADQMFDDNHFNTYEEESRRRLVVFQGEGVHRVTGKSLRRRMIGAIARDFPIVAIAEKRSDIPALLQISADLSLETGRLDRAFLGDLVEALYSGTAIQDVDLPGDSDARWLSLEDLILAFARAGISPRPSTSLRCSRSSIARMQAMRMATMLAISRQRPARKEPGRSPQAPPRRKWEDRTRSPSPQTVMATVAGSGTSLPGRR